MRIMFIDDSEDHNLDHQKIDARYPIFVSSNDCSFALIAGANERP